MNQHRASPERPAAEAAAPFTPVPRRRSRHDGWTAERQTEFIQALAECACVDEACARVGVSRSAAYAFRARADARSFRIAWEAALDAGVRRLAEAAFSRALHGVSRPVFYRGEQIGERRYYDERLAMFLLRYRDPYRYGAWNDRQSFRQESSDDPFSLLTLAMNSLCEDASRAELGLPRTVRRPLATGPRRIDAADVLRLVEQFQDLAARRAAERAEAEEQRQRRALWGHHDDEEEPERDRT
jgi:hypothetical protein